MSTLDGSIRDDFPILRHRIGGRPLVYLDNAATAQKPVAVLDAVREYYETSNSNVGRGYYRLAFAATDAYEHSRSVVRRALNAEHADEIVFTPGTTAALNLVADTFGRAVVGEGDRVVVSGMEHNSNLLPWRRLCDTAGADLVVVAGDPTGRVEPAQLAAVLDERVRLVALTHVSNVLGTVNPVRELVAEAHRHGVPVVVDGAQAVPHRPVDVRELGADFYAFSGHKVYGPMGVGVLYGRRELLSELPPYQVGGGTVKGVAPTGPVRYVPVPARLEAGTPDVAAAVGLAAALEYVEKLGWPGVRAHNEALVRAAVALFGEVPGVRVLGDPAAEPAGIVSIAVPGIHPYDVGGHLDGLGIAVRSGVHCANTFVDRLDLVGTVRFSFAVYNTEAEVRLVREALRTVEPGFWTREHPTERFL
ncbi:aminotransferase class V-fold PLP-dependent enzyme [Phytohabitans suffuscus]|uniref:cysteine desulfurase n=1 Tax=Phytohabitans suffuscus TaxID=624315 RepID=A0A6F8YRI7_9ACTN|nr:cysteine desulfurase [Phytohabitans suffuscus]BCB88538.1 cysteine desulfurase [Phytohabitans suffuscus]